MPRNQAAFEFLQKVGTLDTPQLIRLHTHLAPTDQPAQPRLQERVTVTCFLFAFYHWDCNRIWPLMLYGISKHSHARREKVQRTEDGKQDPCDWAESLEICLVAGTFQYTPHTVSTALHSPPAWVC